MLTVFGIISSLFIAPYLRHIPSLSFKEQSYYVYFYKTSIVFFFSLIVGGSLAAL